MGAKLKRQEELTDFDHLTDELYDQDRRKKGR